MGAIPIESGEDGYDPGALDGTIVGAGIGAMAGRTQGAITAMKQAEVGFNATLRHFSDLVFDGIHHVGGLVTGIISAILGAFFPDVNQDGVVAVDDLLILLAQGLENALKGVLNFLETLIDSLLGMFGLEPIGDLLDKIFDLTDEMEWLNDRAEDGAAWVRGFYEAVTGRSAETATPDESKAEAALMAEAQAAMAAQLAALQGFGDAGGGVYWQEKFDRVVNPGVGDGWVETKRYSGSGNSYVRLDGTQLVPVDVGTAFQRLRFRCVDPVGALTASMYQKVALTGGTIGAEDHWFGSDDQNTRIYVRMNEDETEYVFIEFGGNNTARFGYCNGGSESMVGSSFGCPRLSASGSYALVAGDGESIRNYHFIRNGTILGTWKDTAGLSSVDPENRGWGFGMMWGWRGAGLTSPGAVGSLTVSDNIPV